MNLREIAELEHAEDASVSVEEILRELRLDASGTLMAEPAGPLAQHAKELQPSEERAPD